MMKKPAKHNFSNSEKIFQKSKEILVGGVNSPVRAFNAVGGVPLFIKKGSGAMIYDEDGNSFVDFVTSWGALILGHAYPSVIKAIEVAAHHGTSFGAPTAAEYILAKEIQKAFPFMEKMRFVSSGTEATQSAIRLARGFTGRDKIIKFEGCYHGHSDSLLVKAGSGGATLGVPSSAGIPEGLSSLTLVLPYNQESALEEIFFKQGSEVAAVIVEPIAANMGVVLPNKNFLKKLERLCTKHKTLLIFDEVITGFRVSRGGAQKVYGIKPDITCLGKIIGGGLPVGVYGGRKEIMNTVSPLGKVYQAGTLSGNPLAMAAGLATLKELFRPDAYKKLNQKTTYFCSKLQKIIDRSSIPCKLHWTTGLFTLFFSSSKVLDFESANHADTKAYAQFFHTMLNKGVYFPPSQFEACFISLAHTQKQLDTTLGHIEKYFYER